MSSHGEPHGDFGLSSLQGDGGSEQGDFLLEASSQGDFFFFPSPQGDVDFDDSRLRARISSQGDLGGSSAQGAFDLDFAASSHGESFDIFDFFVSSVTTQSAFLLPFQIFPFFAIFLTSFFILSPASFFSEPFDGSVVFADNVL
jgi:hypothetical protein